MRIPARLTALLLAFALLLPLFSVSAGAAGDLSGAEITLSREVYVYSGDPNEPGVSVTLNGTPLQRGVDYEVAYQNNIKAGYGTVIVTGIGSSGHSGSASASFLIRPRQMTRNDLTFDALPLKTYDGKTDVSFTAALATVDHDQVTAACKAAFADPYVGREKTVRITSVTLSGRDKSNYELDLSYPIVLTNGQITAGEPRVKTSAELAVGGYTLDLNTLIENRAPGQTARFPADLQTRGSTLAANGVLTSGPVPDTLRIPVTLDACDLNGDGYPEYTPVQKTITVEVVEKESQTPVVIDPTDAQGKQAALVFSGSASVYYNETLDLNVTGGSGSGAVTYTVRSFGGDASVDSNGVLTPRRAGTVWVTAQKQGDDRYSAGTPVTAEITIRPARVSIAVKDKTATAGDGVPVLHDGDYVVTGLKAGEYLKRLPTLSYVPEPDMTRPGTVAIRASGAAVPDTGNYDQRITYQDGTLTISEVPVYDVTLVQTDHGTVTADRQSAAEKERITVTAQAEEGYTCAELLVRTDEGKSVTATMLRDGVFVFQMPAASVTVSARFTDNAAPFPFADVSPSQWFYDSVEWAWRRGVMNGTSGALFSPGAATSRAMIVTILYRLEGSPEAPRRSPFADVSQEAYYAAPVAWAAWNGVVSGYSASVFGPNDAITREQLAAILYRYARFRELDVSATSDLGGFSDAGRISAYARTAMRWANGAGLITGQGNGILAPQGQATRAQVAAMLQRFSGRYL